MTCCIGCTPELSGLLATVPGNSRPDQEIGVPMGRRATRPGPPTLLLGVWGYGETTYDNIEALLDDFLDGAGNVSPRFLVPMDKELTTETIQAVLDYASAKDIPYEVVYERKPTTKALKGYIETADKEHSVDAKVEDDERFDSTEDAVADNFVVLLSKKPDDARLLFLWAEDEKSGEPDEDDQRVLAAVADCGVAALDLTQGLDVLDVGEPEPEGDDDKGKDEKPEPAASDEDEPDYETVKDWPVRRIRTYAKKVAAADREDGVDDVPDDDEIDKMKAEPLLDYLFPPGDEAGDPEPEPEKPAKKSTAKRETKPTEEDPPAEDAPVSSRRARQMREDAEAEGKDTLAGEKRRGKAAQKDEEPADEGSEGDGTEDRRAAFLSCMVDVGNPDLSEEEQNEALYDAVDALADVIIDRIAARVEAEPAGSPVREEIAPTRPPGRKRNDEKAPTRRRTAREKR